MARLSEKELARYDSGLFFPGRNSRELIELVRGYRERNALADMLREFIDAAYSGRSDDCDCSSCARAACAEALLAEMAI